MEKALSLFLLFATLVGCERKPLVFKGTEIRPPQELPAQSFTDQAELPFSLGEPGKVTILAFGYANCKTMCPGILATWHGTLGHLERDAKNVRFGFVTIDPKRDSATALDTRMNEVGGGFYGLRYGPEGEALLKILGVGFTKTDEEGDGYEFDHSGSTFLLDEQGRYCVHHGFGTSAEDLAHDVKLLLAR